MYGAILYPVLQGPVLAADQQPETVTESRWHQPWSDPTGTIRRKVIAGYAIALMASGQNVADPFPRGEDPSFDKFGFAWSEPVRVKPALHASRQEFLFQSESEQFPESVTIDRWLLPLSEPKRFRPQLITGAQQALWFDPLPLTAEISGWLIPLSEPKRFKPALSASAHPFIAYQPPPTVIEWIYPWSEPVRIKPGLRKEFQLPVTTGAHALTTAFTRIYIIN